MEEGWKIEHPILTEVIGSHSKAGELFGKTTSAGNFQEHGILATQQATASEKIEPNMKDVKIVEPSSLPNAEKVVEDKIKEKLFKSFEGSQGSLLHNFLVNDI